MKTRSLPIDPIDPISLEGKSKENIYREVQTSSRSDRSDPINRIGSGNCSGKSISPQIAIQHGESDRERQSRLLELHTAERDRLAHLLRDVLRLFRRELSGGYSTAEQQQALREAHGALADLSWALEP